MTNHIKKRNKIKHDNEEGKANPALGTESFS